MFRFKNLPIEMGDSAFRYLITKPFSFKSENSEEVNTRLRSIADQTYDLISQIQKLEKLQAIGQLGAKEKREYDSSIRLVALMIHLLLDQNYRDKEMMDALLKRFEKYATSQGVALV